MLINHVTLQNRLLLSNYKEKNNTNIKSNQINKKSYSLTESNSSFYLPNFSIMFINFQSKSFIIYEQYTYNILILSKKIKSNLLFRLILQVSYVYRHLPLYLLPNVRTILLTQSGFAPAESRRLIPCVSALVGSMYHFQLFHCIVIVLSPKILICHFFSKFIIN